MTRTPLNPLALGLMSALLYGASLRPGWALLGWVALAPLVFAAARLSPARAFALGLGWAVAATAAVAWWLPGMLERYFELSPPAAWLALVAAGALLNGLPYAAFAAWLAACARSGAAPSPLVVGAAFGAAEWLRAHGPIADPFGLLAYSQAGTAFAQLADAVGPYGLSMLLAAASAALATGRGRAGVAALVLLALGYGEWRLSTPFGDGAPIQVAVVQGAVAREPHWDRATRDANLERYLALTRGVRDHATRIVFWPEYAVDFYLSEPTVQRARLFDGVREVGADVVLGASHYQPDESETRYFNSVFVVSADGRLRQERYDKRALVPFAEYGPLGDWLRAPTASYAPGDEARLLVAQGARVGAFVCGEALFPEIARALARAGAQILANPSNDYWFGHPGAAAQQLAAASFRAIENRRYLVRATATGVSAVVDPHGRAIARSRGEGAEVLHAAVRPSRETTLYQRIGDAPVALAAGFVLATLFASRTRARRDFGGPT